MFVLGLCACCGLEVVARGQEAVLRTALVVVCKVSYARVASDDKYDRQARGFHGPSETPEPL
jgi:hypothetical protein